MYVTSFFDLNKSGFEFKLQTHSRRRLNRAKTEGKQEEISRKLKQ